jgi:drug/metabolite transporter (DMT)-like permease
MNEKNHIAIGQAILAAALFGMSAPLSKFLLREISPLLMSALLYLGAGIGMLLIESYKRFTKAKRVEPNLSKEEVPYIALMIVLDILAPISLMLGLTMSSPATASLLNNFEIVTTSVIALAIFREQIGKNLWIAISLITISSIILSVNDFSNLSFSFGSILVLLACVFWGLENNCTRKLSIKDPLQVVILKGFGSGLGSLLIALLLNEIVLNIKYISLALLLGFFAYGMSIFFYVTAQRQLGAARTSTYYAVAPFIGVGISFIVFREPISISFITALIFMLLGTYFAMSENHTHKHVHSFIEHEHRHNHVDGHHLHLHEAFTEGEHTHIHIHENLEHTHVHTPDIHHSHVH